MNRVDKAAHIIENGLVDKLFSDADLLKKVIELICSSQHYSTGVIHLIKLNTCQNRVIDAVVEQYAALEAVRIMIAKSRQVGGSKISAILCTLLQMSKPNFRSVVVANEKERISGFLAKLYKTILDHLPDQLEMFKGEKKRVKEGYYGYALKHNGSLLAVDVESEIRGRATDFLHCSEFAYFKDGAAFLNAYQPTLKPVHGTFAILESTPRTYDDNFHRMFQKALDNQSNYTPLFFPWFEHEENRRYCSRQDVEEIMNGLHKNHPVFGNEVELVEEHEVEAEQLAWRRHYLKDSDLNSFRKEYPASIDEAFSAADSRNVFDMAVLRDLNSKAKEPLRQGRMNINRAMHWEKPPEFKATDPKDITAPGLIQLWEPPNPRQDYVAGSDHSLGRGDWNCLSIFQRMPFRLVATLHGDRVKDNIIPAEFAAQMLHLLKHYGNAHCAIEINDTGLVVSSLLDQWQYPHLLDHQDLFPNDTTNDYGGWRNTTKTRPYAIERLRYYIKNRLIHIPDAATLKELMHFVYVSSTGDLSNEKAQAARKGQQPRGLDNTGLYDDRCFSIMGAILAHEALQPPKTDREKAIEAGQTDHDLLYKQQDNEYGIDFTDDFDIQIENEAAILNSPVF